MSDARLEATRAFFDFVAMWEDLRGDEAAAARAADATVAALLPSLPPAARVVDYGCGRGDVAERLAPHCATLGVVDLSPEMLRRAAERCARFPHVYAAATDGRGLVDVGPATLDLVHAGFVFQHAPRDVVAACLASFAAALKPGGRVVFDLLDADADADAATATDAERVRVGGPGALVSYGAAELAGLAAEAGLALESLRRSPPYFAVVAARPLKPRRGRRRSRRESPRGV